MRYAGVACIVALCGGAFAPGCGDAGVRSVRDAGRVDAGDASRAAAPEAGAIDEDDAGAPGTFDAGAPGTLDAGARAPAWDALGGPDATLYPLVLVVSDDGSAALGFVDARERLAVARFSDGAWQALGEPLGEGDDARAGLDLGLGADGEILVARIERDALVASSWDGAAWVPRGQGLAGASLSLPRVSVEHGGRPLVARVAHGHLLDAARFEESRWKAVAPTWSAEAEIVDLALVADAAGPAAMALLSGGGESALWLLRPEPAAWRACPDRIEHEIAHAPRSVSGASRDGVAAVAWAEHDGYSSNVYAARLGPGACAVQYLDAALDLDFDAEATDPVIAVGPDGSIAVAWIERTRGERRVIAARWAGAGWEPLGESFGPDGNGPASARTVGAPLVAFGPDSELIVALSETTSGSVATTVRRLAPERTLPFGLAASEGTSPCAIPADTDPSFPATLADTGCFLDAEARQPAPGVIAYTVRAPLWSDGAEKRRFVVLPPGEVLGYADSDAWAVPAGTIFIKEFSIPRVPGDRTTLRPIETRFLVKRCVLGFCAFPWQGYSYRWNEAGTEALLLDGERSVQVDWKSGDAAHTHVYPSRNQCMKCHALAAGGVLGLQTSQLNHPLDYGGVIDNQLRALAHAGLLDGFPDGAHPDLLPRLPRPYDAGHDTDARVRSYFHANCAQCHRPAGSWPVLDLRFEAKLEAGGNVCDHIVPGDPDASLLYVKDSAREPNLPPGLKGKPMPPLATLIPDLRQLAVTRRWISSMTTCPP
jgi:hypothetical protein